MRARSAAAGAVALVAAAWAVLIVATPWLAAPGAGQRSVFTAAFVYRTSAVICHQQPGRAFASGGIQWPVCARCSGLYLGGAAGAGLTWLLLTARVRRRASTGAVTLPLPLLRAGVFACGVPTLLTWAAEHLAGVGVGNMARAVAAMPLGAAVAVIVTAWAAGVSFDDRPGASALH